MNTDTHQTPQLHKMSVSGSTSDKDWTGNKNSIFKTLGASSHTEKEREENDFYATEPKAIELLCELEKFNEWIWENACGEGHLSKELIKQGYQVYSSDLIDRGYNDMKRTLDFLNCDMKKNWHGDILTNPPYKFAQEFLEKSMDIINVGNKVVMFLKIQFLEGKTRNKMFKKYPPKYVYVNSSRQLCAMDGEFEKYKATALCYCWYIWEKGFTGDTIVRWID
jgi:hypothetical protein